MGIRATGRLLQIEEEKQDTTGIILLPDNVRLGGKIGKVISAGAHVDEVKKGDRVMFAGNDRMSVRVMWGNKEYYFCNESDVLAVIDG